MEKTLVGTSHITGHGTSDKLWKGLGWGFLGGLVGTLVMDLLLMGALLVLRQPATLCFSIVGDTVSRFFGVLGAQVAGGVATGVLTHYLVGPLFDILALLLGGLELASQYLQLPFKLPIFAILLIALGLIILMRAMKK